MEGGLKITKAAAIVKFRFYHLFYLKLSDAQKRKATLPIGGATNKKIIASTSSNDNSKYNMDEEMVSENEDNQWESDLMLKDPRWSVSKGTKVVSNSDPNQLTPLILYI